MITFWVNWMANGVLTINKREESVKILKNHIRIFAREIYGENI